MKSLKFNTPRVEMFLPDSHFALNNLKLKGDLVQIVKLIFCLFS